MIGTAMPARSVAIPAAVIIIAYLGTKRVTAVAEDLRIAVPLKIKRKGICLRQSDGERKTTMQMLRNRKTTSNDRQK